MIFVTKSIELGKELNDRLISNGHETALLINHLQNENEIRLNSETGQYEIPLEKPATVKERIIKALIKMENQVSSGDLWKGLKKKTPKKGEILIITQYSLKHYTESFPKVFNKKNCNVYIDDPDSMVEAFSKNLKNHTDIMSNYIKVPKGLEHARFCKLDIDKKELEKNREEFDRVIKNKCRDEVYFVYSGIYDNIKRASEGKCDIFADAKDVRDFYDPTKENAVSMKGIVIDRPDFLDGFRSVTFIAANFENSVTKSLWEMFYGVKWIETKESMELRKKLNEMPLEIHYIFERARMSKYFKEKDGMLQSMNMIFKEECEKRGFNKVLFLGNKNEMPPDPSWTICEYENRGINRYSDFSVMVYTGAFNLLPHFYSFMESIGLADVMDKAFKGTHFYQSISRTELRKYFRDGDTSKTVTAFVPCLDLVKDMTQYFANVKFIKIDSELADQARAKYGDFSPSDVAQRKKKFIEVEGMSESTYRSSRRVEKEKIENLIKDNKISIEKKFTNLDPNNEDDLEILLDKKTSALFAGVFQKNGSSLANISEINSEFANNFFSQLDVYTDRIIDSKDKNFLLGLFSSKDSGRKMDDINQVFGLALDFDSPSAKFKCPGFPDTDQTYKRNGWVYIKNEADCEQFESMQLLSHLTKDGEPVNITADNLKGFNSFSRLSPVTIEDVQSYIGINVRVFGHSTFSGGNRRRFIALFDRTVSVDEYKLIAGNVYVQMDKDFPHHNLDPVMTKPNTIYYLPASSSKEKCWKDDKGDELMNVDLYLNYNVIPVQVKVEVPTPVEVEKVEETKDIYEEVVIPLLKQMSPGDRFIKAQRAVSIVSRYCKERKDDLIRDFVSIGGMSQKRSREFIPWLNKIAA